MSRVQWGVFPVEDRQVLSVHLL